MEQNILELVLEGSMKPTYLPLETLRKITGGFSVDRIIGEGAFGTVYKGIIGNKNVAVKRIRSSMTIDQKLFRREVDSLMEVNHPNVVRFLGLCSHTVEIPMKNPEATGYIYAEIRERLLCFEYVNNGSLDTKITDELRGLEWDRRYQIIKGICTGLHYLHMEKHILHMDLKPANILLDHQMRPKITDFGLSRPAENSQTMTTNRFASLGYTAPENLFGCGRMSVKSDIYSLGTIINELVTGQKSIHDNNNILRRWRHRWNKSMKETPQEYHQQVTKCIEIGSLCQKIDPYVRPSISEIMSRFVEIESMNTHNKNVNESIVDQMNPAYWEDDMLGVDPLELKFGYNKNHILSCSVQLSNDSDGFIAFKIQTSSPLPYSIEPNKDILKPRSKCSVDITLLSADTKDHMAAYHYTEEFIVRSIKVRGGLTPKDINQDMFDKHTTGNHVDEIHLVVVSEEPCSEQVLDFPGKQAKKQYISSSEAHEDDKLVKVDTFHEDREVEVDVDATSETTGGSLAVRVAESTSYDSEDLYSPLSSRRLRRTITSWIRGQLLGSGSFGSVYEAISDDGFFFALKEVSLVEQGMNAKQCIIQLENEASLLSLLEHKNIVQYYGTDKEDGKLYIFLELVTQGSLVALYKKYDLQDSQVSAYTRQILNGLNYLHQQNVLHRDIKCANILVDANGLLKLADFGLAEELSTLSQAISCKGTVFWMAPEVAKAKPHGPPADIWSLGCTVLEMLTGEVPYPDMEWTHALLKIGRGIPPKVPNELSEDARDFIARCVQANPEDRPSAAQLLDHPFVQRPLRH